MSALRSDLLTRVVGCLHDHPHDDTIERVTARLGLTDADAVEAALTALAIESLVAHAGVHWQLTCRGWVASREQHAGFDAD